MPFAQFPSFRTVIVFPNLFTEFDGDFDLELNLDYSTIDVILVQPRPVFNFTVSIWLRSNVIHNLVILEYVQDGQYSPLAITATTSQILVNLFG